MLIRSTWTLSVSETVTLPRTYYLELLHLLHERIKVDIAQEKIPSSVFSGLTGGEMTFSKDFVSFHPDYLYNFSLCGLTEYTSNAIASLDLGDTLSFLGANFNAIGREDEVTTYEQLYTNLVAADPEPKRTFNLEFLTPTAFSVQRAYLPLPMPGLMFRSWLERWNHFAEIYLGGEELSEYLQGAVVLKYHKIGTRFHYLKKGYVTGFTGKVTLQVLNQTDPLLANVANLLIEYGQFCGTGVKTRLGMGQTLHTAIKSKL